jgi:nicotinate dehydrogenase subunit B
MSALFSVHGAELSRRGFLGAGGALIAVAAVAPGSGRAAEPTALDPAKPASWIEIRADNTVTIRTGKCDFGQGSIHTAYRQAVAEELSMPLSAMTEVISGDSDRTPDGGGTFGLLRGNLLNMRKAAAYTREAVLVLAAQRFGVAQSALSISNGTISGGGHSATYGALIAGQQLQLAIPVSGNATDFGGLTVTGTPPLKAAADYTIVGQSSANPIIATKVAGKETWVSDVKVAGMLHARPVHPATLGSTLIAAGTVDAARFPNSRVVTLGNFVAVVAPDEWEAVQAAQQVAEGTRWTTWSGLPGHEGLAEHLRTGVDWTEVRPVPGGANKGDVATPAARQHRADYAMPFFKHAPIGPSVSLAEFAADGALTLHTHTQNAQYLRHQLALMLGLTEAQVVVRTYPGPGHFGRSNGGNAGSECEAALLARETGRPVRVQWMRGDDMQWSTQSSPMVAQIAIGLDESGRISSYKADHYGPPMQDDRVIGGLLAGKPTIDGPSPTNPFPLHGAALSIADRWVYGTVANVAETGHGTWQIGQKASPIGVGLRDHSMRTPIQFQQNFPREVAISEAAALAGVDALQFRIDHADDPRFKVLLGKLRDAFHWDARPSPRPGAKATGATVQRGRGVSIMLRDNGYWACAAEVAVTSSTGEVAVSRMALAVDPGIVVNPQQLKRQVQAGLLMGVSQALHEEVTFDSGAVTSVDWATYPILTMAEMPELEIVIAGDPAATSYGQGSEGANALAGPAIAAAFHDATGKPARQLPLKPDYVLALLAK